MYNSKADEKHSNACQSSFHGQENLSGNSQKLPIMKSFFHLQCLHSRLRYSWFYSYQETKKNGLVFEPKPVLIALDLELNMQLGGRKSTGTIKKSAPGLSTKQIWLKAVNLLSVLVDANHHKENKDGHTANNYQNHYTTGESC